MTIFGLLISSLGYAQKAKKEFRRAASVKNDGIGINVHFAACMYPTGTVTTLLNRSYIINFEYKTSPESKSKKIKAAELGKVNFTDKYDDEILGLKKLDMKSVTEKGEVIDKPMDSRQAFLYDGKKRSTVPIILRAIIIVM